MHAWPPSTLALLGVVIGAAASACSHTDALPPHPTPLPRIDDDADGRGALVRRVESAHRLSRGPLAGGAVGDFRMENGNVWLLIAGLGREGGGDLVDGAPGGGREDALRSLTPVVGTTRLRRPRYERLDLEQLGGTATLRLEGTDPADPTIVVRTEYSLHPRSNLVRITTTVQNRGAAASSSYTVGDIIDWGTAIPFAPGIGPSPRGEPSLLWLAAWAGPASYGYFRRDGTSLAADFDQQTVTVKLRTMEIAPQQSVSVQRLLAIGRGGQIAGLLPQILTHLGVETGRLQITVSSESGDPLPGARVELNLRGSPFSHAVTDREGRLSVELPPGPYEVRASTADRRSPAAAVVIRPGREARIALSTGPPSRLVFDVREEGSQSTFPVKLTLFGLDGTPTPWFGPAFARQAVNTHLSATGRGILPLSPGRYRVIVSRGPEFSIQTQTLQLRPDVGASLDVRLRREVTTQGYLGVDIGQGSLHGPGCAVTPEDRVLSNLVEGVDGMVTAEAERAPGYLRAKIGDVELPTIFGLSVRTSRTGALTAFPMRSLAESEGLLEDLIRSVTPGASQGDTAARPPARRVATTDQGPVIQLDGGRNPREGLLNKLGFDPQNPSPAQIPAAIGALRVLDGQRPEDFDQLVEDWFALLRAGRRITATGASGTRAIFGGEAGYPRTYVEVPKLASPELVVDQIVASLRAGRAIVSSGPFIELRIDGKGPGATVTLPPGQRKGRRGAAVTTIKVEVTVWAASWIQLDRLVLYVNGDPYGDPVSIPGTRGGARLKQSFNLELRGDSFVVALVRGRGTLAPVVAGIGAQLPPLALTNPIWIDVNGDGRIDL